MQDSSTNIPDVAVEASFVQPFEIPPPLALTERERLRTAINFVADPGSREGVMADVLALTMMGLAQLAVQLARVQNVADVARAAAPLAQLAGELVAKVESGKLQLPYMSKPGGAGAVLEDMVRLANGVSAALAAARETPAAPAA